MPNLVLERKRLLHFFSNEKLVNDAISFFEEVFPNDNLFVVLSKDGTAHLVKQQINTIILSYNSKELRYIVKECHLYKEILCHSMWYELAKVVSKMDHPNITWIIWGSDLYEELLYRRGYKVYIDEEKLFKIRANKMPVPLYKCLIGIRDYVHYRTRIKANNKISAVASYGIDYDLMVKYFPEYRRYKNKEFFYYPIERMLDKETQDNYVFGNNIWVNHSAAYNGNHIDILKRLSRFRKLGKVCVPLSYGIKKWARYVEKEGRKLLGNHFDPMMEFLPKEEYYKNFLGSNSFVFGHLRQCGVGNILVAFYLGAKVFLFKTNPLYPYYRSLGLAVFTIEEELTEDNVYTPLSDELRVKNRSIIIEQYSYSKFISVLKNNF